MPSIRGKRELPAPGISSGPYSNASPGNVSTVVSCDVSTGLSFRRSRLLPPWPVLGSDPNTFPIPGLTIARPNRPGYRRTPFRHSCFFGTLQALGSRSALNFIIRKIYPLAKTEFGANGFRIKICGAGKFSAWAERQLAEKPEIEFLGFVDDLGTLFSQCHAVIAPIDTPIGNRSRILTAMANRLLVIAHENTALGNPDLVDGRTCFLAKTPVQFVSKMRQATNAGGFAEILKDRALAVYQTKFAPEQAVTALMKEAFDTTAF